MSCPLSIENSHIREWTSVDGAGIMAGNLTDPESWQISQTGKILITAIFAGVVVTGIVGNVLVITVVLLVRQMRTSVNLCLFSLALSDLLVMVFLPILPITYLYDLDESFLGKHLCTFAWLMDRGIVVCSVLTFLLVGVERYTVLCYPLKSLGIWTLKRVSLLLVLIWTISVGVSIPFGFMTKFEPCGTGNSTRMCCYLDSSPWFSQYETILTSVALFLPIPLLVFLYGKMIVILRKQVPPNDTQHQGVELARRGRSQIIVMLVVLLILFIICLIPFNVYIMWYIYTYVDDSVRVMEESVQFTIEWLFRIMVYVNHMVNPIVYFLMSANFRRAFRVVFCQCRSTEDQLSTSASSVSRLQKSWA